jgi:uncharacterized protein
VRYLWFAGGWFFVGIGAIGVVLPGVPTTFPMILALGCFARSSPRFYAWLYHHRVFGPSLQRWSEHRVIPIRGKVAALTGMGVSLVILLVTGALSLPWLLAVGALMAVGAAVVLSCPSAPPVRSTAEGEGEGEGEQGSEKLPG